MPALQNIMSREWKDKTQTRRKYLHNMYLKKDCYQNIDTLKIPQGKKLSDQKNGPKTWKDTSTKKISRWQISTWKEVPIISHQGDVLKATMRYCFTPFRMAKIKNCLFKDKNSELNLKNSDSAKCC